MIIQAKDEYKAIEKWLLLAPGQFAEAEELEHWYYNYKASVYSSKLGALMGVYKLRVTRGLEAEADQWDPYWRGEQSDPYWRVVSDYDSPFAP